MPMLNTTSTGDISFMLLIFFLVMTSIDTDKGLVRQLPPMDDGKEESVADIDRRNVLELVLTASGQVVADGRPLGEGELGERIVAFVDGTADPRKHIIKIDIDNRADYNSYFSMQNEIVAAYNTLRDRYARKTFGRPYRRCTSSEREQTAAVYPQRIAESSGGDGKGGAQ